MRILVNDFAGHPFQLQLSRELARGGHCVLHTYFAANNTPQGATGRRENDPSNLVIQPLSIGRRFNKHSALWRRFDDIAYGKAVSNCVGSFKPDVVISANMPLDAQNLLFRAARTHQARLVFWLQDLLSVGVEFAWRQKRLPLAALLGTLYSRLERKLLRDSDAVVCIAPEFRHKLEQWGIHPARTFVIENWAPVDEVRPLPRDTEWAREHGLAGKFCFMYAGTLGIKHKPELLLQLAKHFESRADVVTVAVAQGAGADWLRANAKVRPGALLLLPFQPYERMSEVLAGADVLIALLDPRCGEFAIPSKVLAYLCAGRPLLVAAPPANLAAQSVRRASAGHTVEPDRPDAFLAAAAKLLDNAAEREQCARNARAYAERTFRIQSIAQQFSDIFEGVLHDTGQVREPETGRRGRAASFVQ